jgi:hypothetical protein
VEQGPDPHPAPAVFFNVFATAKTLKSKGSGVCGRAEEGIVGYYFYFLRMDGNQFVLSSK